MCWDRSPKQCLDRHRCVARCTAPLTSKFAPGCRVTDDEAAAAAAGAGDPAAEEAEEVEEVEEEDEVEEEAADAAAGDAGEGQVRCPAASRAVSASMHGRQGDRRDPETPAVQVPLVC